MSHLQCSFVFLPFRAVFEIKKTEEKEKGEKKNRKQKPTAEHDKRTIPCWKNTRQKQKVKEGVEHRVEGISKKKKQPKQNRTEM